ncbi:molybdopterin cofactor-binding domain-containing protein [Algiphilus sp.]|uniref:xanthine dehydrogenase family protein molybdopterin-binding subunit n=1 Tax=Algiphilus sp. TaxID=1872431 RepID=UPI003C679591
MHFSDPARIVAAEPAAALGRRDFLKGTAAAGLVLGLHLAPAGRARAADTADTAGEAFAPNAFVRVSPDNTVTLVIKHHEMGQGVTTGLSTILAEELDADLAAVRAEYAPSDAERYGNLVMGGMQGTGGSTAIANSWMQMRMAGATARAMLVAAAAERWDVPASDIVVSKGVVSAGERSATFGELAEAAAQQAVPGEVALKDPSRFVYIGKRDVHRLDSKGKTDGTATYGIDVQLPGLLTAVIARPPAFGATLRSFDAAEAKKVNGVEAVLEIPEGVAVVATGMWPAIKGRKALEIEWDLSTAGPASSEALYEQYEKLVDAPGTAVTSSQDTEPGLAGAATTIEAGFRFPYLAHAAMEPMNGVAWLRDGRLETWAGHQFPSIDHPYAAEAAGLDVSKVELNTLISGGSFGRRANGWADFTVEAVHVARALKEQHDREDPVRVQWTREDDTQAGLYRPLYVHRARIGLDADGNIAGWRHTVVGQSIMAATEAMAGMIHNGVDESSVEGVSPTPYAIPAFSVALHSPEQPVRPLWWRSVGHTHTAYAMETLMDELAEAAGRDPVEFRLALLGDAPRVAGVLKLAADKGGWSEPAPEGRARGIAVHKSFSSYVAEVAEVSMVDGMPKVHRVTVAVDCGVPINPDQIAAQMEGGVGFALAAALYGEIGIEDGKAQQANFDRYQVLRMPEMPQVDVHIVPSQEAPTGVGEPGVPPLAPAVANAVHRLTGKRVRRLPFARAGLGSA